MGNLIAISIFFCLALASAVLFLIYPGQIFVWYLLVKPIVDGFLEQGASIGGTTLSFSYLPSLIMPTFFLLLALFHANRLKYLPYKGLVISYMILNIFAFFKEGNFSVGTAGYYIRVVFPIFLFFGVPIFVEKRESLEKLIKIAAFSGTFPCAMIFLQKLGFIRYNREAEQLGSIVYERATGGYSDSFSVALPIIIAIFFLLNIIQRNKEAGRSQKIYEILLGGYLFSLVFTFHRMTYVVVAIVLCMWMYFNKRAGYAMIFVVLAAISFSTLKIFLPDFFGDVDIIADQRNTTYVSTTPNSDFGIESSALHGRGWLWKMFMKEYFNASFVNQMVGIRLPGRAPHNDYIRVLFTVGIVGLMLYLFMLFLIGLKLLSILRFHTRNGDDFAKNLSQTSIFMFVFYVLGGMTLTISTLSTMSWYFWILFGIVSYQYEIARSAEQPKLKQAFSFR